MNEFYKIVCRADEYLHSKPECHKLSSGDVIVICDELNPVKPGEQYKDYPAFILRVFYSPKKWWQFWKKSKQLGYIVEWE